MRLLVCTLLFLMNLSMIHSQELTSIDRNGFSIKFPNSWEEKKVPDYLIYIMESDKKSSDFSTTIGIQETKEDETLEVFSKQYEIDLSNHKKYKDFKIKVRRELMYGNRKAIRYFCTATVSHIQ